MWGGLGEKIKMYGEGLTKFPLRPLWVSNGIALKNTVKTLKKFMLHNCAWYCHILWNITPFQIKLDPFFPNWLPMLPPFYGRKKDRISQWKWIVLGALRQRSIYTTVSMPLKPPPSHITIFLSWHKCMCDYKTLYKVNLSYYNLINRHQLGITQVHYTVVKKRNLTARELQIIFSI